MSPSVVEATVRLIWKEKWTVASVADGIEALLGYTAGDFLTGKVNLAERIHAQDGDIAARLFTPDTSVEAGSFNVRLRHRDGHIRLIRGEFRRQARPGGAVQLDLLLQEAKSLWQDQGQLSGALNFRAVMESTDDYIYFKDRNHVFTGASRTLVALTSPIEHWTQLLGKTDYDVFPEGFADIYYQLEKDVFAGIPAAREIQQTLTKDGIKGWVDNRKYPIHNDTGEIMGLFGIARDITGQMRAQEELRQREEWLQESQEIAGVGSYSLDIQTGFWSSSKVLDRLFGIGPDYPHTVEGWVNLIHPLDRTMMASYFADEVVGRRSTFDKEYRYLRQDDETVHWAHGRGRLDLDAQGNPWRMRGTIQDLTERKSFETKLCESRELLQMFVRHALASLAMLDREMRFLVVSQRFLDEFHPQGREEDFLGKCYYDLFPNHPREWREVLERGLAGEMLRSDGDYTPKMDGTDRWLRWEVQPWRRADGSVGGIVLFTEDITAKREADDRLLLAASVFTNAREAIIITSANGAILDVNDAFTQITGYERQEVLGRNPRFLQSGRQNAEFYAVMWRALVETGQWSGEIWNRAKDGRIFPEMLTISAVRDAQGKVLHYVALAFDISALKEHERKLEHFALYDPLTGLPNRVFLADRMHQAMAHCHRRKELIGVAYLDLDAFKAVNDLHGHDLGDQLLTAVAARMKNALREDDTLARLGGDEFVAVLLDLEDTAAIVPVVDRLLQAASEPVCIGELTLQVSASIGITFYPQPEEVDADQLLRQADQAMYQAKLLGRNRFYLFDAGVDRRIRGRHEELEQMRRGLVEGQFELFYQPKVNMREGKVLGAEALIRWRHPQRGLLLPGAFLPAIEDHPLAIDFGEWVIATALCQIEAWSAAGLDLPVSVNMGARQLQQADFVERLAALLAAHPQVNPARLELEILETSALHDVAQTSRMLKKCIDLGVSFALDDFGAGYSSLVYLKQLPARVLKIDRVFITNILDDPEDLTILEGVLGLGFAFRRQCIAEGVETAEQGLKLLGLGCELAQGFCIARPMPAPDFPAWMTAWHPPASWMSQDSLLPEERRELIRDM
jgi:diguanylate cyclase (GGDEF)-like protein/PAS domain S-box-containing protein